MARRQAVHRAATSKCTWDLLQGKRPTEKLRVNPRKAWYGNLDEVVANGDFEVTFQLKRPQPAFIALLASGFSPVYPCHVPPPRCGSQPIGTGPFKFVEFKPNETIKVTRNPDYWKKGRPYLDGIEYQIIKNQSTGALAFVSGTVDMTSSYFFQVPMLKDIKAQAPQAICELMADQRAAQRHRQSRGAAVQQPELRRAVALTLDRKAFIDTLTQGKGTIGGALLAPPEGIWGMPPEVMQKLPGYDPDVAKNRAEAREHHGEGGLRPEQPAEAQGLDAQHPALSRPGGDPDRPAEADLHRRRARAGRHHGMVSQGARARISRSALNLTGNGIDDPDQTFFENYACGSENNYDGYCNPEIDKLFERQSMEGRPGEAQADGLGDRAAAGRGRGAAGALPQPLGHLLASLRQGLHADDQQHLQRPPHGGRLAGQIGFVQATVVA